MFSLLSHPSTKAIYLIAGVICYVVFLLFLALRLSESQLIAIFSEDGFFEQFSIVAWILAAIAAILCLTSRVSRARLVQFASYALFFLICAMREADWHKKFTSQGILKLRYYTSNASLTEKIPAALVSAIFLALLVHAIFRCYLYAKNREYLRHEATWVMLVGILLFFFGKILDRSVSVLQESLHWQPPYVIKQIIRVLEEGLEMLTPILIGLAFLWHRSYANNKAIPK